MKFFKVTLNTVGKDNEKIIFVIPPIEEKDENGNPAYDEDFLLCNDEYKSYLKATKAAVVSVSYVLYEADNTTKLNYDELLKNEEKFFKLEQNEYLIEVKKAKPKSGSGGKKTPTALYIILGVVIVAVAAMLIYGALRKGGNSAKESETSADTYSTSGEIPVDTYSTTTEAETPDISTEHETIKESSTETSSEASTTTPTSSESEPPTSTTATEITYTLTFDTNGGAGSLTNEKYKENTVVELPFTGINRVGYTLMGWATAPTEPYTLYDNETSKFVMPSAPATLYAIWTASEYEVIYNYQVSGNAVTTKERGKYGEIIQLMDISGIPSDKGEFVGWGLLPDSEEPVQSLTMPDGGIELYAIYKNEEAASENGTTAI